MAVHSVFTTIRRIGTYHVGEHEAPEHRVRDRMEVEVLFVQPFLPPLLALHLPDAEVVVEHHAEQEECGGVAWQRGQSGFFPKDNLAVTYDWGR